MSNKFFYAIDERKKDNSKNNVTAFKEHLSPYTILEIILFKHENIRLLID